SSLSSTILCHAQTIPRKPSGWQSQCGTPFTSGRKAGASKATIGQIGFEHRSDYAVIGTIPNLAARLCEEAKSGQIGVCQRSLGSIEQLVEARSLGELHLKGFHRPMEAFEIIRIIE